MGYTVVSIVGPTASGKSELALNLSKMVDAEVLSADSMQVYQQMDIGTAKTRPGSFGIPIHGIDLVRPDETYSVALYQSYAHKCIDDILSRMLVPVVCGGTGLYVRAALEHMDFPKGEQSNNCVRMHYEALAAELGADSFYKLLEKRDPASATLIHPNNVRRVVRAFELLEQGTSYAEENKTLHVRKDRYPTLHIGLTMPRELLYQRINDRVDLMMEQGLVEEVSNLMAKGLGETLTAKQAIGYKEIIAALEGRCTLEEAVEEIKRSSRRYAKRQYTWFNSDSRIKWFDVSIIDKDEILSSIVDLFRS